MKTGKRITYAILALSAGLGWSFCGCTPITLDRHQVQAVSPRQAQTDARATLLQGACDSNPITRTHAMEAIGKTLGPRDGKALLRGLADPSVTVRFAAAMAAGDMPYRPAEGRLIQLIINPATDQRVVCAAIYALHRLGNDQYAGQLGSLLFSDFDLGRATAAMVMGKMSEPSAVGPLQYLLRDEKIAAVQVNIVEALARLGDKRSLQILESYVKGYFLDLRLAAIPAIARVRVPQAELILENLLSSSNEPRVRVAAAGGLGMLGSVKNRGYDICRTAMKDPQSMLRDFYGSKYSPKPAEISSLQQLAAISLGQMRQQRAVTVLNPFLKSSDGPVRIAAAMSILKILPTPKFTAQPQQWNPKRSANTPRHTPAQRRPGNDEPKGK